MKRIILNRNENHYGPAPACMKVIHSFKKDKVNLYLEGSYVSLLTEFLAKKYKVKESQVIASYGGEDFLRLVYNRLRLDKDSILTHEHCFGYYKSYANHLSIPIYFFKMYEREREFSFDIENCIEKCKTLNPAVLILASPNNYTGNSLPFEELELIMNSVSDHTIVILDEVYWGFDKLYNPPNYSHLLEKYPNLIFLRSFSKFYALAGLRIGFALCGEKAINLLKYQKPYVGLSRVLEEVAIAAMRSENYYQKASKRIQRDRSWLLKKTRKLNHFTFYLSKANFVLFKPDKRAVSILRKELNKERRIFWRELENGFWRVTIGLTKDVKHFYKIINNIDTRS